MLSLSNLRISLGRGIAAAGQAIQKGSENGPLTSRKNRTMTDGRHRPTNEDARKPDIKRPA